ncbi:MAG: TIGR03808 family TAT-translocated repetitive protein [Rhizobiales bacterium]|nr:TIGR03808 family TAT-translocated repetitive protein [Hyphomicrobiales bacterium]MBO6698866.1 TIGR03808 family TAT-translocated repetitive protein [Hyphomicrobiales bacterium]MBO6734881.1 TIGR03808 family TAT-translocated repetitive protein [Hyphomicrobiales bacterium]MBO6911313.1 TIGR03808 family TAT-translocated repetitive protein [Hyphomicrobiales bacterium]MBO6956189.1 TIGR03808 family TAT-translocated repetitive protein [Hyphomicrobiales bacterium]
MLSRRTFLTGSMIGAGLALPVSAKAQTLLADLRGSLDVSSFGVRPGALDNQSTAMQEAINRAAQDGQPLFMPAGDYLVSNIDLPSGITIVGVPGRTRIRYAGDGHLMFGNEIRDVRLEGLVLDGNNRPLADYTPALLHISTGSNIAIEDCIIQGSLKDGVTFDRVAGRIENCTLSGILGAAIQSNDAQGLAVRDNVVSDCSDNGILIFRWSQGRDGTIVSGNRIERIRAISGGTGPYGNGINVFRANDVIISGNVIDDCDFSAVRCNASSNVQMVGNTCTRSGEVAMFAEFGFQGAIVANNVIDGAANGISIANFADDGRMAIVQGNIVRNIQGPSRFPTESSTYGTGIGVEADTTVTNNIIEDVATNGINAGWGPYLRNVIVSQNLVRRTPIGVMVSVVDGVGPSVIRDNIFDETPDGAVVGMRWWDRATGDLTKQRHVPAPLVVEGNRTVV